MRILNGDDVRAALTMPDAIAAVKHGFMALSLGRAQMPVRALLPTAGGVTLTMPAYLHGAPICTVKIVSVCGGNAAKGLPVVNGSVMVLDAETGLPRAILDGGMLTAIRTGAGTGLATDLLARPDAAVLGVIGAGVQARTQIEAVCAVRPIQQIRIFSPRSAALLAVEISGRYDAEVIAAPDRETALLGAEVIVAATNSALPVVWLKDLAPGVHINGIGSYRPDMQEIAPEIAAHARVVIDHRESAWHEAGELIAARDAGLLDPETVVEIGEVAAGLQPGRTAPDQITFFKSVGSAVQDAATAARVLEVAEARGLGVVV